MNKVTPISSGKPVRKRAPRSTVGYSPGVSPLEVENRLAHIEVCLKHAIDQLEGALDSVKVLRK